MLATTEMEQLVLYETMVDTDHGRVQVWLDGLVRWKVGVSADENPVGGDQVDSRYDCWSGKIENLLDFAQQENAFKVAEPYVAALLRDLNQVFADSTDPLSENWQQGVDTLRKIWFGLADYFVAQVGLVDVELKEDMPLFASEQRVKVCGGLREYQLFNYYESSGETLIWVDLTDFHPAPFEGAARPPMCSLADLVDYARPGEMKQILELHLFAMVQLGEHLRYVINKLRAGVPISLTEFQRLQGFAVSLYRFREEFTDAT